MARLTSAAAGALAVSLLLCARPVAPQPSDAVGKFQGERLTFYDDFDSLDLKSRWKPELSLGGYGNWVCSARAVPAAARRPVVSRARPSAFGRPARAPSSHPDFLPPAPQTAPSTRQEFQAYTNNRSNLFVKGGSLYLKPTLATEVLTDEQVRGGYTLDIRGTDPASLCTADQYWGCLRTSGAGGNVINPVASARVRTAEAFAFRYGRLEVRARLPRGDWLWPAIWLLPRAQAYGPWPASGEIDVMESRGNAPGYPGGGGSDSVGSTLHWGPDAAGDRYDLTHAVKG